MESSPYYAAQCARNRWHVIAPDGIPIYDNAPHGQDRPVVFKDEDEAMDCAERLNQSLTASCSRAS